MALTDRASLLRELFRLTDTESDDEFLTEHDSGTLEGAYLALQHGIWNAQEYMINQGLSDWWVTQSSTITTSDWQGTDAADGGRYVDFADVGASDFLRLAGDETRSALRQPNGTRWGHLIDFENRFDYRGQRYWLQGTQLWITRGASPPNDLIFDYHYEHATLADSTTVTFPKLARPLIPAEAAVYAMEQAWLPGGQEMEAKLLRNLRTQRQKARSIARRDRGPRKMTPKPMVGTHYYV